MKIASYQKLILFFVFFVGIFSLSGCDIDKFLGRDKEVPAAPAPEPEPEPDPVPVSITNPDNGSTVSGTISVTANASDDNGISKVEFYIDGSLKSTDTSSPYSYSWNTTAASAGAHTVKVIAYDTEKQTASDQHTVTVDNSPQEVIIEVVTTADTYVWKTEGSSYYDDKNFGNESYVKLGYVPAQWASSTEYGYGYLYFAGSSFPEELRNKYYPYATNIESAILRLYIEERATNDDIPIALHNLSASWGENTVTWNNKPSYLSPYNTSFTVNSAPLGFIFVDVTSLVQGWINQKMDSNKGICMKNNQNIGGVKRFSSQTANNPPTLIITYMK